MRVMLTTQVSGTRNGQNWPAPGTEIDLPDDEAEALVIGGVATKAGGDASGGTVLVSPAGVHQPGITAHGVATTGLVEVPIDAVADPEGTRQALKDVAEGNLTEVPAGVGTAAPDGTAFTAEQVDKSVEREERVQAAFAETSPKVGEDKTTAKTTTTTQPVKTTPVKHTDSK